MAKDKQKAAVAVEVKVTLSTVAEGYQVSFDLFPDLTLTGTDRAVLLRDAGTVLAARLAE